MNNRLSLHNTLLSLNKGKNVYFQPPPTIMISYPAIIYTIDERLSMVANNDVYGITHIYKVTVITKDPDSTLPDAVGSLAGSRFLRHYVSDNLIHDVYKLNYQEERATDA